MSGDVDDGARRRRITAGAFNHVSPYFADVVWRGLSTQHVRAGLEGHIGLDDLRRIWMPISPWPFIPQIRGRKALLDLCALGRDVPGRSLTRSSSREFERQQVPTPVSVLPCGHYTTGKTPFKFIDGYYLTKFFVKKL